MSRLWFRPETLSGKEDNMSQKIYVNRTLNMKRIKYIGLDMDHTVIRYNSEAFEETAFRSMLKKLVNDYSYPKDILNLKFDFKRAIRGLVLDKNQGNVLKLSRHTAIRGSYHGLSPIDYREQNKLYKSTYIDLSDPEYEAVDTSFSISYATLFAQLVDFKDQHPSQLPDYTQIALDMTRALDRSHRDGSIKDVVTSELDRFIIKDKELVEGFERYIKHGKKIFIVTNSDYRYSKLLLDYAINPFLKDHSHWSELFEFTITLAGKPRFFFDHLPFLKIDPETGLMQNHDAPLVPGIYQGGCATKFTDDLKLEPNDILYIGDHIYGDIVRLKKDCAWRTALVVEEIEEEQANLRKAEEYDKKIEALMSEKIPLERKYDDLLSLKIETGKEQNEAETQALMEKIQDLDKKIAPLINMRAQIFNPYWGEVMRTGIEESYFAYQVERFACIYMAKLNDFFGTSPRTYYRSLKRDLPHEVAE